MTASRDIANRVPITLSIILATTMTSLDMTIVNVALPHMQGSLSAGADQINWVLTSYIISGAIMTPLAGWLAARVGRKRMFLLSIAGFTAASMLCGLASGLVGIIVFRVLQGASGAAIVPLSQATVLDVNHPEKHGQAMAVWGAGVLLGQTLGPALGGYITEHASWRWCFYINLPLGILACLGVWLFMSPDQRTGAKPFDFLGFGMLTLFIGALQLVFDRGPGEDWFYSQEVWAEAVLAAIGLWVFVVHSMTTSRPFFDPMLLRDRNFLTANIFSFAAAVVMFTATALTPPMMQTLLGYPVLTAGIVSMPRGAGTLLALFVVSRLIGRMDTRLILLMGLSLTSVGLWQMTRFDLSMTQGPLVVSGFIQGFGAGFIYTPLSTLAFASLPAALRPEGSSFYNLTRNMGGSFGISVVTAILLSTAQTMHASIAGKIVLSDAVVRTALPRLLDPTTPTGAEFLNAEVTRQALMVAYVDIFRLMLVITLICIPAVLLMRKPKPAPMVAPAAPAD